MKLKLSTLPAYLKLDRVVLADKLDKPAAWIPELPKNKEEFEARKAGGEKFDRVPSSLVPLCERMVKAAAEHDGVGIAANQIGINRRMCVIKEPGVTDEFRVFFHPSYTVDGESKLELRPEGCLSVPRYQMQVPRQTIILAEWFEFDSDTGKLVSMRELFGGDLARIYQHEVDHLLGRSILDYAPRDIRRNKTAFIKKLVSLR